MKGKGKGERGGMSKAAQAAAQSSSSSDEKDCPLQFPDMKPVDHPRLCPRYTAVLQRTDEDGIGIEELDTLQTELETLLASVAKRMRQLEAEISILSNWQDVKGKVTEEKKTPKAGKSQPEGKRVGKGSGEDKPNKKFKDSKGNPSATNTTPGRPAKGKSAKVPDVTVTESPKPPLPPPPKNDIPNKFWAMVEPYCTEINKEDLQVLEDIMRSHEDDADYHKVPCLGKHYSQKWAQEDLNEEQREGSKVNDKRRSASSNNNSSTNANENNSLLKRATEEKLMTRDDESPFGPLTQRLVSALIEENIMTPLDDTNMSEADAAEAASMSPKSLAKHFNIGSTATLERRIKRELEDQGILETDDRADDNPQDEILAELRRKQQELRVLSQQNLIMTKRLYKLAKEEMSRQDLRRKMAAADADVMDAYRKIQASRAKKKSPTKKEKDVATRALRERETIIRQLENV